jgi:hypothetical protein
LFFGVLPSALLLEMHPSCPKFCDLSATSAVDLARQTALEQRMATVWFLLLHCKTGHPQNVSHTNGNWHEDIQQIYLADYLFVTAVPISCTCNMQSVEKNLQFKP